MNLSTLSTSMLISNITTTVAEENHQWWMPVTTPMTEDQWHERVDTAIIFSVFCVIGIFNNALPILFTFCTSMRKNNVHIMVGSISTSDFGLCFMFLVGQTRYILYREELDMVSCRWMAWFTFITAIYSFLFPPQVSMNRYISLCYPEYYERVYTTNRVVFMVVGTWLISTIIPFIFVLGGQTGFDDDNEHCCIVVKHSHWAWTLFYWVVIIVPLVLFCDGTMMFCNYKIYKKLSEHNSALLKHNIVKENKEILYFLMVDLCLPIIFHTLYHVAKFAYPNRTNLVAKRIFMCFYLLNSSIRGLATLFMLRPYRRATRNLFCFWKANTTVAPTALPTTQDNRKSNR